MQTRDDIPAAFKEAMRFIGTPHQRSLEDRKALQEEAHHWSVFSNALLKSHPAVLQPLCRYLIENKFSFFLYFDFFELLTARYAQFYPSQEILNFVMCFIAQGLVNQMDVYSKGIRCLNSSDEFILPPFPQNFIFLPILAVDKAQRFFQCYQLYKSGINKDYPQSEQKAQDSLVCAAGLGEPRARFYLGKADYERKKTQQQRELSIKEQREIINLFIKPAAECGYPPAFYELAKFYHIQQKPELASLCASLLYQQGYQKAFRLITTLPAVVESVPTIKHEVITPQEIYEVVKILRQGNNAQFNCTHLVYELLKYFMTRQKPGQPAVTDRAKLEDIKLDFSLNLECVTMYNTQRSLVPFCRHMLKRKLLRDKSPGFIWRLSVE